MTTTSAPVPALLPQADDPAVTRILDAALELFEDVGIRKSTIEDVARRAGVDRVTVYRRVGSKTDVAQAVIAREAQRLFERVTASTAAEEALEDRVVAAFTGLALGVREHVLFNRLLRLEPDQTLPRVTTQASGMLAAGIQWATDVLIAPDADGPARDALTARVEIIARFVHSTMLTRHGVVDLDTETELAGFARTYIVPIVAAAPPT